GLTVSFLPTATLISRSSASKTMRRQVLSAARTPLANPRRESGLHPKGVVHGNDSSTRTRQRADASSPPNIQTLTHFRMLGFGGIIALTSRYVQGGPESLYESAGESRGPASRRSPSHSGMCHSDGQADRKRSRRPSRDGGDGRAAAGIDERGARSL